MIKTETAPTKVVAPAAKPEANTHGGAALALDKAHLAGRQDNNGALLGVVGAKFVDAPAADDKDNGSVVLKYDANGNPLTKDYIAGLLNQTSLNSGAGDSYKAMSRKLEAERQAAMAAAAYRHAEARKTQIVDEIRHGNSSTALYDELAKLNNDVFNLPAGHTGY